MKISIKLFFSDWRFSADLYLRWKKFFKVFSSNYFMPHTYALKFTKLVLFFVQIRFHCCWNDMNIVCKLLFRWKNDISLRQIYPSYLCYLNKKSDIYNFFCNRVFELMLHNNNERIKTFPSWTRHLKPQVPGDIIMDISI